MSEWTLSCFNPCSIDVLMLGVDICPSVLAISNSSLVPLHVKDGPKSHSIGHTGVPSPRINRVSGRHVHCAGSHLY